VKRVFWILLTPTIFVLLASFAWTELVWPRLSIWGIKQAKALAFNEAKIKFDVESVDIQFFKPTLIANKFSMEPPPGTSEILSSVAADEIKVQIDPFELLLGRFIISAIVIQNPKTEVEIDSLIEGNDSPPEEIPLNQIFKSIALLPIKRVFIEDGDVTLNSKKNSLQANLKSFDLGLFLQKDRLQLKVDLPQIISTLKAESIPALQGKISLSLDRKKLKINEFKIQSASTSINLEGEMPDLARIAFNPLADVNIKTSTNMNLLAQELKIITKKDLLLSGTLSSEGKIKLGANKKISSDFSLSTQDIQIEQFKIGEAVVKGELDGDNLRFKKIEAIHPAGHIVFNNSELELKKEFKFKSEIEVKNLNSLKLFHSLGLNKIPVNMDLKANLPCEGKLSPFSTNCKGWVSAQNLQVKSESNFTGKSVIEMDELYAEGSLQVDSSEVKYNAQIKVANNVGSSEGSINFETGFKINYKTPQIDFANVKNLFNLKFEGQAQIEGTTEGNSDSAIFDMNFKSTNFAFEDFKLGSVNSDVSFRSGKLFLKNIQGSLTQTQYSGQIDVNLDHNDIVGNLDLPKANAGDIFWIIDRKYPVPVSFDGNGQARVRFEGPLDFWKLSYKLDSEFKNGKIGTETFNKMIFSVSALDGNIKTDQVEMFKNSSSLKIDGTISTQQKMKLTANGKNFKLEESELINTNNESLFGILNFDAELNGTVSEPEFKAKGSIRETVFDEQETPDSQFDLRVTKQAFEIKSDLFGAKIKTDVVWPFEKSASPMKLFISTKDWNFTQVLSLFNSSLLKNEYNSSLTTTINLKSDSGDFNNLSGRVDIVNFYVKRGTLALQNESPMDAVFENGQISLENFELKGPDNSVKFVGKNFALNDLNIQARVELEMRILHILMPFFEELNGPAKLTATFRGPFNKPEILGNAYLNEVFFKFKNFPHAFERVESEIVFSHSKILIEDVKGQIAGGQFSGQGNVQIQGPKDIPTMLNLKFEGVSLNMPDKVKSTGSADLTLSGRWFPFLISGTYNISYALYEKELSSENDLLAVKQSLYLPKSLKEESNDPLAFDLTLALNRPAEIKNSQVDGTATGQLQFKGTTSNPILLGKLNLEKNTKLIFKDKVFELQTGNILFSNPSEINPDLYISAQSRVNDYDISLLVQGAAKNPSIKLTSLPPMPETEIISLLALGITSSKLEQSASSNQQAEQSATEIGAAVLSNTAVAKTLQNKLGVNIQISNTFDSTKNISIPKATISGRLSKRVNYYFSRTIRDSATSEVKFQYLINSNLSGNVSIENREEEVTNTAEKETKSILGLDLEYKREFR